MKTMSERDIYVTGMEKEIRGLRLRLKEKDAEIKSLDRQIDSYKREVHLFELALARAKDQGKEKA